MTLDLKKFFQATNPGKTLFVDNAEEDKKYYIDFSAVRGGQIIEDLKDNIALWSSDDRSCQLKRNSKPRMRRAKILMKLLV